jgi:hypothetical protein
MARCDDNHSLASRIQPHTSKQLCAAHRIVAAVVNAASFSYSQEGSRVEARNDMPGGWCSDLEVAFLRAALPLISPARSAPMQTQS